MDRNTIIAILLIFLIWTFWPGLNKPPEKKALPPTAEQQQQQQQPVGDNLAKSNGDSLIPADGKGFRERISKTKAKPQISETERVLENELVRITLGSSRAHVKKVLLKNYGEENSEESARVEIVGEARSILPFSLLLDSENSRDPATYLTGFKEVNFNSQRQEATYSWEEKGFLRVERDYQLLPGTYDVLASVRLKNIGSDVLRLQPGVQWNVIMEEGKSSGGIFQPPPDFWQSMYSFADNELEKNKIKLGGTKEVSGNISWSSLGSRYFLLAVFPRWQGLSKLRTEQFVDDDAGLPGSSSVLANTLWMPQLKLKPGDTADLDFQIFLGPKELRLLEAAGNNLNRSLDLGMFEFFALFLLRLMQFFNRFLGNWGLSIIVLTFVVKIAFFPLSHKSFKSMKEMQRIQPLMNEIKERYKDDKEQLNVQMLKIMREHKVNPLGGCLPMLIQMPIYFALYKVLYSSIELRHAPFCFWIQDLSARDPFFVSPVLMGVAMFLQQRFSPKPPDPTQAKMMMIMPIMFTGFLLFLPSGLVIYIFCNTVLSILQQWYINKSGDKKLVVSTLAENRN